LTSDASGPGFARDIQPLFLPFDRDMMRFAFDLWAYPEVKQYAAMILERLELGDMPCDRPWPQEQIALFRAWMAADCLP
jgi:hypothetical protein